MPLGHRGLSLGHRGHNLLEDIYFNQSEQSSPSILLPWGIKYVGPMLYALDETTLARMSLSTAKAVRQEHRMPFARSLRHALRIFCQAHNALQVALAGGPHNEALVTNLERATKLLHITPALLQSSDDDVAGRDATTSTQGET